MAKKWSEVRSERERLDQDDNASAAAAARADLHAELEAHAFTLGELRRARALTQVQLAGALEVSQAQVSRIEKQADLLLSTLASYVAAMGGDLELVATFPDRPPVVLAVGELTATERPSDVDDAPRGVTEVLPTSSSRWTLMEPQEVKVFGIVDADIEVVDVNSEDRN